MQHQHYDVIVIGNSFASIIAAAFIAKNNKRVLLIESEKKNFSPSYLTQGYDDEVIGNLMTVFSMPREMLDSERLNEIQFVFPKWRLDWTKNTQHFDNEIEREFPKLEMSLRRFYEDCGKSYSSFVSLFRSLAMIDMKNIQNPRIKNGRLSWRVKKELQPNSIIKVLLGKKELELLGGMNKLFDCTIQNSPTRLSGIPNQMVSKKGLLLSPRFIKEMIKYVKKGIVNFDGELVKTDGVIRFSCNKKKITGIQLEHDHISCDHVIVDSEFQMTRELFDDKRQSSKLLEELAKIKRAKFIYTIKIIAEKSVYPEGMKDFVLLTDSESEERNLDFIFITKENNPENENWYNLTISSEIDHTPFFTSRCFLASYQQELLKKIGEVIPFLDRFMIAYFSESIACKDSYQPNHFRYNVENVKSKVNALSGLSIKTPLKNLKMIGRGIYPMFGIEGEIAGSLKAVQLSN